VSGVGAGRYSSSVMPNGPELIIILVVILLLFGGSQLPKLARSLGQAQGEFKKGTRDSADEPEPVAKPDEPQA
jgi:sec-independent protein translocase protein TatA